ncbi:MAG: right-handed parallel beta-helix repeat-containing protein [Saprospiraceae bacterium]|nr:right-handed parallel beta-helix repeat-containing protein [Saprospiraceae bacterium]
MILYSKILFFCLLFFSLLVANVNATTFIGQHIDKDSKWTKSNSPYIITIDLTIVKGATLEIEPGTKVQFAKETRMIVSGNLVASGTKSQKISFSGLHDCNWNGFFFTKDCNDFNPTTKEGVTFNSCIFRGTNETPAYLIRSKGCNISITNCNIEACYTAIQIERQAEIWIDGSVFKHCNRVINVRNTSLATITNNKMIACNSIMLGGTTIFKDNILRKFTGKGRHSGIIVWMLGGGVVDISSNQFVKFEDYAIKLQKMSKRSSFLVHHNTFRNNNINLKLSCKYYNKGKSKIENNSFYNYKEYHVRLFAPCKDKVIEKLSIGPNFWGKLSTSEVKNATLDYHHDENISGEVEYSEVLKKGVIL